MRVLLIILAFSHFGLNAQTYTFECVASGRLSGDSCDICPNTIVDSRSFNGLVIFRDSTFYRWVDQPYSIRTKPSGLVEYWEHAVNPYSERITIPLSLTGFSTIEGMADSTWCNSPGPQRYQELDFDSISAIKARVRITGSNTGFGLRAGSGITFDFDSDTLEIIGGGGASLANNGLTMSGDTVQLGGTLIKNTSLNGTFDLKLGNTTLLDTFSLNANRINLDIVGERFLHTTGGGGGGGSYENLFFGYQAGAGFSGTGYANTVIGRRAGFALAGTSSAASSNILIGYGAGEAVTDGSYNVILGTAAGTAMTTATNVTALGYHAGRLQTGSTITAVGQQSLENNTASGGSTAVGYQALQANTSGNYNTAVGTYSGTNLTTNNKNTLVGFEAGRYIDSEENTLIGYRTGGVGADASYNTVVGSNAGAALTSGNTNTLIGRTSGTALTTGVSNVFVGKGSGSTATSASSSIVIGRDINLTSGTVTGEMNIGGILFGTNLYSTGSIGINVAAPTQELHVSGDARVTGAYYDSNNDPGTNTQILSSTATGTDWVAAPTAPTILTVSNGLTLVGTNAKWGGTLVENTTIAQATFYQLHNNGRKEFMRYNANPFTDVNVTSCVDITGKGLAPSINIAPSEDAILTLRGHDGTSSYYANAMFFGTYATESYGSWIQTRSESAYTTHYPLNLNANGGKVGIGRDPQTDVLDAHVTVSRSLSGSTITGILLHLENTEGNKSAMSFGKGYDVIDGEIGYFDSDDIVRLTNRNTVNLSSSIRFAIGGETSDRAVLLSSTAASNARLGVGFTNATGLNSTMHSKGSIAGATLTTSGSPTFDETKFYVAYTGAGNQTYTLPAEAGVEDRIFWIENYSAAGIITLSRNVKKANGASFNTIDPGQHAWFISDGVDYRGFKITSE